MPDDPTPLGDAMTHRFANQKIPDPKPNAGEGQGGPAVEDEEADPVIDTGPGIDDGVRGPKKQRG